MPALLTILESGNPIRFGSMDDAFRAAETEVPRWKASDIDLTDANSVGLKGSPTKVKKVFAPTPRTERARMIASDGLAPRQLAEAILDRLIADYPTLIEAMRDARAARQPGIAR
jgi:electron transfer flavoprotein beta subunit